MAGKRIDDHSFWAGKGSNASVLPVGNKVQTHTDDGHDGHLSEYEDTDAAIRRQQEANKSKAKSKPMKTGYRN